MNERAGVLRYLGGRVGLSDTYNPALLLLPQETAWTQVMGRCGSSAEVILKPSGLPSLPVPRPMLRAQSSFSRVPATNLTVLTVNVVLNT